MFSSDFNFGLIDIDEQQNYTLRGFALFYFSMPRRRITLAHTSTADCNHERFLEQKNFSIFYPLFFFK